LASITFYAIIATYFLLALWCLVPCAAGEGINAKNTQKQRRNSLAVCETLMVRHKVQHRGGENEN